MKLAHPLRRARRKFDDPIPLNRGTAEIQWAVHVVMRAWWKYHKLLRPFSTLTAKDTYAQKECSSSCKDLIISGLNLCGSV